MNWPATRFLFRLQYIKEKAEEEAFHAK